MNIFGLDNEMLDANKEVVEQIVANAEKFMGDNRDAIKKLLNEYLQKNELLEKSDFFKKEKIFFLSGQTIASLLADVKGAFEYNDYNDLDIFITSYGYETADEFDENENLDAKYWGKDNNNNTIEFVVNDGYDPVSLRNIGDVKPQFIKIFNTYSLYQMKDVSDRMQKAAFMILDNFDLNNVKIGLAVNSQLDSVDLIIHPDLIDNLNNYGGLPTISKPALVTLMRSLNKFYENINMHYVISERNHFFTKYVDYFKTVLNDYRYANHLCGDHFAITHQANIKYQINTLKKYFDVVYSASHLNTNFNISDKVSNLNVIKEKNIEHLSSKLVTDFDGNLIYASGQLFLDSETKKNKTILESILEKIMQNEVPIMAVNSTALLIHARRIKNKNAFDKFVTETELANLSKETTNWIVAFKMLKLFIKNFDILINEYSVQDLAGLYKMMIKNDYFIKLIAKHYYQDKLFMIAVKELMQKRLLAPLKDFFNKYGIVLDSSSESEIYLAFTEYKITQKIIANESLNIDDEIKKFIRSVFREEETYFSYDLDSNRIPFIYMRAIDEIFSSILGVELDDTKYICGVGGEKSSIYAEVVKTGDYDITSNEFANYSKLILDINAGRLVEIDSSEIIINAYPQIAKILKKRRFERMISDQV